MANGAFSGWETAAMPNAALNAPAAAPQGGFWGGLLSMLQGAGNYMQQNPTNVANIGYQLAGAIPGAHPGLIGAANVGQGVTGGMITAKAQQQQRKELIDAITGSDLGEVTPGDRDGTNDVKVVALPGGGHKVTKSFNVGTPLSQAMGGGPVTSPLGGP